MISPRSVIRARQIAVPRIPSEYTPTLPLAWRRLSPRHLVWLAVWAPWWLGNELPPPPLPRSGEPDMVEPPAGSPGAWLLDTLDDLKFRFGLVWTFALALRGAWLGGIAGIFWLLLGLIGAATSPEPRELAILAGIGAALGLVLRLFHRPRYGQIALLLERAFDLRSRLSTAVAGLRFGATRGGELHELQLADAANALDRARSQLRPIHWVPIRELFIGLIVALALLLLMVAQRPEGEIDALSRAGVPPFVPVSERLAASREQAVPPEMPDPATLQQVEDTARTSNQSREDLETIAGALQTDPNTAPAGDAISNEDYAGANQQLDESAEDVTQMPQGDREKLADELDEAGDKVSDQNPELADSAHRAADDVRDGEDTGGLGDLGDQIEQTGEDVLPQQSDGGELSDSTSDQSGASQAGSAGDAESAQAEQPQSGEQGAGQTQASSQGDPGSGMNASAGTGESGDDGSTSQGEGGQNNQQQGSGGEQGQPADAASSDDGSANGQQGEPGAASQSGGSADADASDEGASSQGSGAGGGDDASNDVTDKEGSGGGDMNNEQQSPESSKGEAGDPPPGGGDGTGDQQRGTAGGDSSVQLPGTSDERVRSGSDIGASSVGSGGGIGAGSGASTGSASGSTGPDPNTVPAQWRSVVEDYFREGGSP